MSNLTLIIGNKNYSSWSLRPWIFMRQLGVKFNEKRIPLFTDTMEQDLAAYGSNTKVPVLLDDDLIVWDTLAIMEYVSEKYLDNKGWPLESKARAVARSISAEMHSSFTNIRNELPMNCRKDFPGFKISLGVQTDIDRIAELWRKCRSEYGAGGDWLFGNYSIADAMYAPVVIRLKGYDVRLGDIEESYMQSVLNLPAMQEWIEAGKQEKEVIEMDEA